MKKALLILSVITCGIMMSCNPPCDCNEGCNGNCCGCEQNNDDPVTPSDETEGFINGYAYVDLGLPSGTKWATHNIGATTPEGYGEYYQWGMTTPPADGNYSEENCATHGIEMPDISGDPQYDAARANWGSTWRMPTREEMQELEKYCEWEWTQVNGRDGAKVTGPNGSYIFLPTTKHRDHFDLYNDDDRGVYWTSLPENTDGYYKDERAIVISFEDSINYPDIEFSTSYRWYGRSIRPVSD